MELNIVKLETAKLAKEKEFGNWTGDIKTTWNTRAKYFHKKPSGYGLVDYSENIPYYITGYDNLIVDYLNQSVFTYAPEQALLQKWIRDIHGVSVNAVPQSKGWKYKIDLIKNYMNMCNSGENYSSYEEALEAGLLIALQMI